MRKETKADYSEAIDRLLEIRDEIKELIHEARGLLPRDSMIERRAESYWIGHILTALDDDSGYCGRSMCSLQDSIDELSELDSEDEDAE